MEQTIQVHTVAEAALSYIERGWAVLPLRARAKEPLTAHGWHDASTDIDQVTEWWDRWPNANNIGIASMLI